jgi:hypothetical protein
MPIRDFLLRLIGITRLLQTWHTALLALDSRRRAEIADYADQIAATFARAAQAFTILERTPADARARRDAVRELGRISGYLDDLVAILSTVMDGRKLAGFRRRLAGLAQPSPTSLGPSLRSNPKLDSLIDAEGYFRALADGLRA